jgi:DNA-binding CsgD family transcriptional regulator/GAF domain-containing protein
MDSDSAGSTAARHVLANLMQLERELIELRYTQRLDATERVREALRRLADAGPPPLVVLERAAAELGAATSFDRVLVSRVRGEELEPLASWSRDAARVVALPRAGRLRPGAVEVEAAASRRTTIVEGPAGGSGGATGWRSFVLAPITMHGEVVAVMHAAREPGALPLGELDRELVELFAAGLAGVLDRAALEHALVRHRGELAAASRFLDRRLGVPAEPAPPRPATAAEPDPLTARELEVLSLIAQGHTNRTVAQALRISEGTVKYHVKNLMRKLHARSRADAVARHRVAATAATP